MYPSPRTDRSVDALRSLARELNDNSTIHDNPPPSAPTMNSWPVNPPSLLENTSVVSTSTSVGSLQLYSASPSHPLESTGIYWEQPILIPIVQPAYVPVFYPAVPAHTPYAEPAATSVSAPPELQRARKSTTADDTVPCKPGPLVRRLSHDNVRTHNENLPPVDSPRLSDSDPAETADSVQSSQSSPPMVMGRRTTMQRREIIRPCLEEESKSEFSFVLRTPSNSNLMRDDEFLSRPNMQALEHCDSCSCRSCGDMPFDQLLSDVGSAKDGPELHEARRRAVKAWKSRSTPTSPARRTITSSKLGAARDRLAQLEANLAVAEDPNVARPPDQVAALRGHVSDMRVEVARLESQQVLHVRVARARSATAVPVKSLKPRFVFSKSLEQFLDHARSFKGLEIAPRTSGRSAPKLRSAPDATAEDEIVYCLNVGEIPSEELCERVSYNCAGRREKSTARNFVERLDPVLLALTWHARRGTSPDQSLLERVREIVPHFCMASDFKPMHRFLNMDVVSKSRPHPCIYIDNIHPESCMKHMKRNPEELDRQEIQKLWRDRAGWTLLHLELYDKNVDVNLPPDMDSPEWKIHKERLRILRERFVSNELQKIAKKHKNSEERRMRKVRETPGSTFTRRSPRTKLTKNEMKEVDKKVGQMRAVKARFPNKTICRAIFKKKAADGVLKDAMATVRALLTLNRLRALGIDKVRWMKETDEKQFEKK